MITLLGLLFFILGALLLPHGGTRLTFISKMGACCWWTAGCCALYVLLVLLYRAFWWCWEVMP